MFWGIFRKNIKYFTAWPFNLGLGKYFRIETHFESFKIQKTVQNMTWLDSKLSRRLWKKTAVYEILANTHTTEFIFI